MGNIKTLMNAFTTIVMFVLIGSICVGASENKGQVVVDDDKKECPNAGFQNLQDAINSAKAGNEIKVCSGSYNEQIEISKSLKLIAEEGSILVPSTVKANTKNLAMDENIAAFVLIKNTKDVTIEGLQINGKESGLSECEIGIAAITFEDASGNVKGNEIKNLAHSKNGSKSCENNFGIFVQSSDEGEAEVLVEGNKIHGLSNKSIVGANMGTIVRAKENLIVGTVERKGESINGVYLDFGATGTIQGNKLATSE